MAGRKKKVDQSSEAAVLAPEPIDVALEETKEMAEALVKSEETDTEIDAEANPASAELSEYETLLHQYGDEPIKAMFRYCFDNNLHFSSKILHAVLVTEPDKDIAVDVIERYRATIEEDPTIADKTFFGQLRLENFERVYSEELSLATLSEEDKKNRMAVMDILAYDPFKDDDQADRPQLYRDLTGMLTENMRKDVAKAKAALSIVRGYNNLDKYQRKINEIMKSGKTDEETQETLNSLIKIQKTLQDSINTTAERNNFTIKGIGNAGRGMLSDVMNQIEEKGIDEGVTNFYDIATSKAIEEIANISFKAQLNQVNFSKTDYADILAKQSEIVREAQLVAKRATEAARLAKEKIKKQQLLEELEKDYRKKGIKESEMQDFINREYHLYDGTE